MKTWHPIIGLILTTIFAILNNHWIFGTSAIYLIEDFIGLAYIIFIIMLIYVIIRNIVRAIRGRTKEG